MKANFFDTLLSPENTFCALELNSKKSLLEFIAKQLSKETQEQDWVNIFNALVAREKYGSTGFGNGIAIPHCRSKSCLQPTSTFIKLANAIDFDALDGGHVDLIFALIVPEEASDEHLEILSRLAQTFDSNACRVSLRDSQCDDQLFKRIDKMLHNIPD